MICKYYDCGWCYAPDGLETSKGLNSSCISPETCPQLSEKPVTDPESYISLKEAKKIVLETAIESYDSASQAIMSGLIESLKDWRFQLCIRIAPVWTLESLSKRIFNKINNPPGDILI